MEFKYQVETSAEFDSTDPRLCISRATKDSEVVVIQRDENGNPMILANQEGWRYLAKVCVEMAYAAEKDPFFHMHRDSDFGFSGEPSADRIGLFQIAEDLEKQRLTVERAKRNQLLVRADYVQVRWTDSKGYEKQRIKAVCCRDQIRVAAFLRRAARMS